MLNKISIALLVLLGSAALTRPSNAQFEQMGIIAAHTDARAKVGVPTLDWDPVVAEYARLRAAQLAANCRAEPSKGSYGENIVVGYHNALSNWDFVKIWVNEKVHYDYNTNSCALGKHCGNYTQVVWHDSSVFGCAKVECDDVRALLVCNYSPHGNVKGEKPYRVNC